LPAGAEWKRHTETKRGASVDWDGEQLDFLGAGPGVVEELSFVRLVSTFWGWILSFPWLSFGHHCFLGGW
jgi:hypothetical protein